MQFSVENQLKSAAKQQNLNAEEGHNKTQATRAVRQFVRR